jgi:hypothetical protein
METRSNHNHNQRGYNLEVDRTPYDVIFSITTPVTGAVQRLHVVVLGSGNELLLYPGQHPTHCPQPKGCRSVLTPTVLHDTPRTVLTEGVADNPRMLTNQHSPDPLDSFS